MGGCDAFIEGRWKIAQDKELQEHARQALAAVGAALPSLVAIKERVATVMKEDAAHLTREGVVETPAYHSTSFEGRNETADIHHMPAPPHQPIKGTDYSGPFRKLLKR